MVSSASTIKALDNFKLHVRHISPRITGANARNTIARAAGGSCGVVATVNDQSNTVLNSIRVLPTGGMLSSDKANGRVVQVGLAAKMSMDTRN